MEPGEDTIIGSVRALQDDEGRALAFVHELEPEGYIITSASIDIRPIIGFSFDGHLSFKDSERSPVLDLVKWDMEARLSGLQQADVTLIERVEANRRQWIEYTR